MTYLGKGWQVKSERALTDETIGGWREGIIRMLRQHGCTDPDGVAAEAVADAWWGYENGWLTAEGVKPMAYRMARHKAEKRSDRERFEVSESQLCFDYGMETGIGLTDLVEDPATPQQEVERNWQRAAVANALGRLPKDEYIVITCRYFFNDKIKEIAQVLGVTERTVQRIHQRALLMLASDKELLAYRTEAY